MESYDSEDLRDYYLANKAEEAQKAQIEKELEDTIPTLTASGYTNKEVKGILEALKGSVDGD
jgi:hypothetical protein